MTETVSNAVATQKNGVMAVVDTSTGWFASILPSHVEPRSFIGMTKAYLKKNSKLMTAAQRNPAGFMIAMSECARLGLVPGDTFHVVPFGSDFTGITDYTGEIELIYRAGAVSSVKAEIVYANDTFSYQPGWDRPEHVVDWFSDRGEMIGVYAYAVMKDGATSRVVLMNRDEVLKVKAVSKTANQSDSPWKLWEDRMWLKTAVHQLEKWVPTSAEFIREHLRASVEADNMRTRLPVTAPAEEPAAQGEGPVDAEIVEDPPGYTPEDDAAFVAGLNAAKGEA